MVVLANKYEANADNHLKQEPPIVLHERIDKELGPRTGPKGPEPEGGAKRPRKGREKGPGPEEGPGLLSIHHQAKADTKAIQRQKLRDESSMVSKQPRNLMFQEKEKNGTQD